MPNLFDMTRPMVVAMRRGSRSVWRSRGFAPLVALLVASPVGMAIVMFSEALARARA